MTDSIKLIPIGRYDSGIFDDGAAEITAYDSISQCLFVVNGAETTIDVLDVSDPTNPTFEFAIAVEDLGAGANSVAIKDGILAAAIESDPAQEPGKVVFFDTDGNVLNEVTVGALPDMVTFTPDGKQVLVANEGEPDEDDPDNDPEGLVSIIDISEGVENPTVTTADFTAFNGREAELRGRGVRIFPDKNFANDAEPEYITVSPDSSTTYVSLQENNAVAVVDLEAGEISEIQPLGLKDFSRGLPQVTNYPIDLSGEVLGTTPAGQEILLAPEGLEFIAAEDSPNGEPLLAVTNEVSGTATLYQIDLESDMNNGNNGDGDSDADGTFTLQLLHAADQEAGIPALEDAPNFSAVLNSLKGDYDNTVVLSSGDAYIPGPFFAAGEVAFGGQGRGDILIQNELGFSAIALGNHEFDFGTGTVADLISAVDFTVTREAAFNNTVGFYEVNKDGSVNDSISGLAIARGESGYLQAALDNSIGVSLTAPNNGKSETSAELSGDALYAPFLVVDGTIEQLTDDDTGNDPRVFFAYAEANTDNISHVRSLEDNSLGFEDIFNGGDMDFDDVVVEFDFA